MARTDKEIKALEKQQQSLQASIAKRPKDQQAAQQAKLADLTAKGKELRQALVPPAGDKPAHDKAGFYWNEMIGFVRKVLADPKAYHPEYDPKAGYEVAGGLWFSKDTTTSSIPNSTGTTATTWCLSFRTFGKRSSSRRCPS